MALDKVPGTKIQKFEKILNIEKKVQFRSLEKVDKGSVLPEFFTAAEVAKILNVSYQTVDRLMRRKDLEFVRIGRARRVSKVALADYKASIILCQKYPEQA